MNSIKAFLGFAILGLIAWGVISAILWVGDLWDGVIDQNYENELVIRSEVSEIDVSQVEVQWHVPNRVYWLTQKGKFQNNLPEVEGRNHFRIFIQNKPVHTFYMNKARATRKYKYTIELRDKGEHVRLYFGYMPHFYHDDAVRSPGGHQMADYPKARFVKLKEATQANVNP